MTDPKRAEKPSPVDKSGHSLTPGPWRVVDRDVCSYEVLGADDTFLMSDESYYPTAPDREHAEHIVRCVNAHGELLEALAELVRFLEPVERDGGLDVPGLATLNRYRAALSRARGGV